MYQHKVKIGRVKSCKRIIYVLNCFLIGLYLGRQLRSYIVAFTGLAARFHSLADSGFVSVCNSRVNV